MQKKMKKKKKNVKEMRKNAKKMKKMIKNATLLKENVLYAFPLLSKTLMMTV